MRYMRDNKGIALVTSLMFALISMGIVMMLLYSITQGTKVTGASKVYKTSLDAGYGAVEVLSKDILPSLMSDITLKSTVESSFSALGLTYLSGDCFDQKMTRSTSFWDSAKCGTDNETFDVKTASDLSLNLKAVGDSIGYTVYTKIVDTRCGGPDGYPCSNSDSTGVDYLDAGGGVTSSTGTVTPQHRPAYYRIELQAERASNPREKSQLSVLYAY